MEYHAGKVAVVYHEETASSPPQLGVYKMDDLEPATAGTALEERSSCFVYVYRDPLMGGGRQKFGPDTLTWISHADHDEVEQLRKDLSTPSWTKRFQLKGQEYLQQARVSIAVQHAAATEKATSHQVHLLPPVTESSFDPSGTVKRKISAPGNVSSVPQLQIANRIKNGGKQDLEDGFLEPALQATSVSADNPPPAKRKPGRPPKVADVIAAPTQNDAIKPGGQISSSDGRNSKKISARKQNKVAATQKITKTSANRAQLLDALLSPARGLQKPAGAPRRKRQSKKQPAGTHASPINKTDLIVDLMQRRHLDDWGGAFIFAVLNFCTPAEICDQLQIAEGNGFWNTIKDAMSRFFIGTKYIGRLPTLPDYKRKLITLKMQVGARPSTPQ